MAGLLAAPLHANCFSKMLLIKSCICVTVYNRQDNLLTARQRTQRRRRRLQRQQLAVTLPQRQRRRPPPAVAASSVETQRRLPLPLPHLAVTASSFQVLAALQLRQAPLPQVRPFHNHLISPCLTHAQRRYGMMCPAASLNFTWRLHRPFVPCF